jgi:hypothetical protein
MDGGESARSMDERRRGGMQRIVPRHGGMVPPAAAPGTGRDTTIPHRTPDRARTAAPGTHRTAPPGAQRSSRPDGTPAGGNARAGRTERHR